MVTSTDGAGVSRVWRGGERSKRDPRISRYAESNRNSCYLRVTWRCWETSGDIQKILAGSLENAGASTHSEEPIEGSGGQGDWP